MKFSNSKKYKIRKRQLKQLQRVYNSSIYTDYYFPDFILVEELRENRYWVISKHYSKDNYYILCKEKSSEEICILKLFHVVEGVVKAKKLSDKNVLKNQEEFRKWIKSINFERRKERVKYYLRPSGKLEVKSTDYSNKT